MKKKILIASFDLEVGGIERSLLGLLENFDYSKYDVDLMLYSHTGEFMKFLPDNGYMDLGELIREYLVMEVPYSPVCKEDCKGLCPVCGKNLNFEPHQHPEEE